MSSPFRIFRRHQKVMMVVLVGLSMLSFVVCGPLTSGQDLTGPLMVGLLALAVGSIAWLMGLNSKKSTEYGAYGLLIGACAGLLMLWNFSTPPAIRMKGGDISHEELESLQRRRILANNFVQAVMARINAANPTNPIEPFAFGNSDPQSLAFGEILRREADRMGIVGSQETVSNFLMAITTPRDGGGTLITSGIMQAVCRELGTSEQAVYEALQDEWRMLQVQRALSGGDIIPPETFWDAHQKLNVQQDMELAILPASEFVDASLKPSDAELEEFFTEYRENFPNFTADGQPEEGRPGFAQPRRAQFAYIEATADEYLDQVTVTPEEIDAEYIRRYPPPVDEDAESRTPGSTVPARPAGTDPFLNGPVLPPPPSTPDAENGEDPDAVAPESSETPVDPEGADPADEPAGDAPETESTTNDPASTDADAPAIEEETDTTPEATESTEEPSTDSSCDDPVVDEAAETAEETTETPVTDDPATETEPTDPVDPTSETPDTETPVPTDDAAPVDPATTDATETETPTEPAPFILSESEDPPPPPLPGETGEPVVIGPPPLTDELRAEIEEYLRLIKADALLQENLESFAIAFEKQIRQRAVLPPESDDHMSLEDAIEAARALATEEEGDQDSETFEFYFAQTPLLSSTELRDSEEHTIGSAVEMSATGSSRPIASALFQDFEDLHRPVLCESPTQSSAFDLAPPPPQSRFVIWKIADLNSYAPESLDDDREGMEQKVRDQVVESWQLFKARESVETRAAEIVELANAGTGPFSTIFADTKLIGDDGLSLNTTESQHMSWYRQSSAGSNFMQQPPPEMNSIPGLPDVPVGQTFMRTVFREMEMGETRAVWNADYTYMFVVRVKNRIPASQETFIAELPNAFNLYQMSQRFQQFRIPPPPVLLLAQGQLQQLMSQGTDLFEEYEVQFADELSQ